MYREATERYNCSKSFSDASNSSDIKERIIKQINNLSIWILLMLFLSNSLHQRKNITVKKKLI